MSHRAAVRPRTAVITGAPGAGKTALVAVLATRGRQTVGEAARVVLSRPGGMALRNDDPLGFAVAMVTREIADLAAVGDDRGWTIFDRGIGDSLGFARLAGLSLPTAIATQATALRYSGPIFLAPAWPEIYRQDAQRTQDWDQAVASGEAVATVWKEAGYDLIELPRLSPDARADFVEARLS